MSEYQYDEFQAGIDINPIRGIIPIVKSIGLASLTAPIHVIGAAFS